ncbi:MAG: archease [Thiohalocapsa sp.]
MPDPPLSLEPRWRHFEHRADIGVEGCGATPSEAFEQAALALTAIVCDPDAVAPLRRVHLICREPDLELLFVDWLNAVIYRMATEGMLFSRYRVRIDRERLEAVLEGEPVDRTRHRPAVEVKGATYTELAVRQNDGGGWCARCIIDV